MSNQIQRTYNGADAYMLEASEEIHDLFLLDIADFTAFDSHLDNTYATAWLAKVSLALGYKSDNTVVSEQKGKTVTVEQAMKDSQDAYNDLTYFAVKAFKTQKTILDTFGKGKVYDTARKSQAKLIEFMDELITITDTYKTGLLAAGCPQATIDAITTTANALHSFNNEQNATILGRPVVSSTRVKQLNDAYAPMLLVLTAAQRVYKNNATKLEQYVYNPPINHRVQFTLKTLIEVGKIVNLKQEDVKPQPDPDFEPSPQSKVHITATGSSFVFYFAHSAQEEPSMNTLTIAKDKKIQKTVAELKALLNYNDTFNFLNAKNYGSHQGQIKIVLIPE